MNQNLIKKYSQIVKLIFWGMLFLINLFIGLAVAPFSTSYIFFISFAMIAFVAGISYLHINYLIVLLKEGKKGLYGISMLSALILVWIVDRTLIRIHGLVDSSLYYNTIAVIAFVVFVLAVNSLIHLLKEEIIKSFKHQVELSNQKLIAELNFLKAQINPHFLFNTLNNIYSYAYTQHPEAPAMIKKLSGILRYIVYDCKDQKTSLNKELDNMENLFSLYRMKNDEQENIIFKRGNYNNNLQITPLILLNLLENAFKHGNALSNKNGFINARVDIDNDNMLSFEILNTVKKKGSIKEIEGIGQSNVKKQLDLLYPNKYELETKLVDHVFTLQLILELDQKD